MKLICETQRLYLREFTTEDAIHFYEMNNDEDVIKYTGDNAFKSESEAKIFLSEYKQYQLHNMGRWAVCLKETGEFIGWCGLKYHPVQDMVEVGYRFYRKHWNKGYATESAKAAINYGFKALKLKAIYAHAHINNIASHKVIEKCGLHFIKHIDYDGMPINLYKIEATLIEIKQITAIDTYPVRQPVLREGRPIEDCAFENDELPTTFHLGLYLNNNLAGVATYLKHKNATFKTENQYQLRGMAILKEHQGKGLGELLIKEGEKVLKQKNTDLIWFNARENALNFYKRNGYNIIGGAFEVPLVGTHFVMYKSLNNSLQ